MLQKTGFRLYNVEIFKFVASSSLVEGVVFLFIYCFSILYFIFIF